ncbi:sel1 repeat family protein [Pseudomonas sp. ADAK2]|uniref:sel1 repeat family protein n=1 Tax=unclassified Pseudomonas TaxID=196821 RepID=UPI0014638D5E|nr:MULTISPECIES: sel1 repeat family protein [unclassified Pseudomonas]QJI42253.1 sel1 repeat family protein [Pseudomonas sp. ADAK7]QJI48556.1 sel1 repeat family protein [Pseudomonas sp. ADAK2]
MNVFNVLPLAFVALLAGCSASSEHTTSQASSLNDTLPKLTLQSVLPSPSSNKQCNAQMDSDILFGLGFQLYGDQEWDTAKSCLELAAPKHPRAFCYLSMIAGQDESKTPDQRNSDAFNYMAYSATQNDWCAEYGLYQAYQYGSSGAKQDPALASRWLERSSVHGYPEAQKELIEQYEEQGNLVAAYAWTKIMAKADDTTATDALKTKMTAAQIADGEKRYTELAGQVTSKKAMFAEAREEDVGRYSAEIYQDYPDTFKGLSSAERYDYVKQSMYKAIDLPFTKSRGHVLSYIVINRAAQLKKPDTDIANDQRIVALMEDDELSVAETIEHGLLVVNKFYR